MANAALREVAAVFLRLGLTAFGGPAAHIALMEAELVRKRQWLTHEEFLDLLGAVNLLPGPNSTEMAIHLGLRRAGWPGLLVAGACFILPAAVLTLGLAWAYVTFGQLPQAVGVLACIKPVIVAVVAQALWQLLPRVARTLPLRLLGLAALVATALGADELAVLVAAGLLAVALRQPRPNALLALPLAPPVFKVFLVFAKIGAVLFGSGYVLLAFLRHDLVARTHWLTEAQLLDAVAAGQFTPGPVFTTATFIGYLLGGVPAAIAATLGIFLPAFVLVALSARLVPMLRRSPLAGAFLDGVNVASVALMAAVAWQLARVAVVDAPSALLAAGALALLVRFRMNSAWLVLAGAAVGLLRHGL